MEQATLREVHQLHRRGGCRRLEIETFLGAAEPGSEGAPVLRQLASREGRAHCGDFLQHALSRGIAHETLFHAQCPQTRLERREHAQGRMAFATAYEGQQRLGRVLARIEQCLHLSLKHITETTRRTPISYAVF